MKVHYCIGFCLENNWNQLNRILRLICFLTSNNGGVIEHGFINNNH